MSLELCVLASGSLGNCTVVRSAAGVLLVDIGIGPRLAAERLKGTGIALADVGAVCLTHLDSDHLNDNWFGTIRRRGIAVHCHASRAEDVSARASRRECKLTTLRPFDAEPFEPLPGLSLRPIPLSHDEDGSHGFVIEGFGCRAGYATDLGHVPEHLVEHFCDLDLLAIESNYDQRMQIDSPRPWFLKRRIMGGRGHLSNAQAYDAVRRVLGRSGRLPRHIVLLHRSRDCNCPDVLRRFFSRDTRIAPRLVLAEQFHRTGWLRALSEKPHTGEQLALAFA